MATLSQYLFVSGALLLLFAFVAAVAYTTLLASDDRWVVGGWGGLASSEDDGGTCGKDGQWVPVSMGMPTVKVTSITVGGAG